MRGWVAGVLAVVVAVMIVGVAVIAVIASEGATSVVDLEAGDCFELPDEEGDDGEVRSVDLVDCDDPHLAEVVLVGELDSDGVPYPDDEELFASVDLECRSAEVVQSDAFGLLPIAPTLDLWESFNGRFLCVAIPFGGEPTTGSIVDG